MKNIVSGAAILGLVMFAHAALCQMQGQQRIDSLLSELPHHREDSNKVKILYNLSYDYFYINFDEGIKCGQQGLQLAEKLNWDYGKGNSLIAIGMNLRAKADYPAALTCYYKALTIFEKSGEQDRIAMVMGRIGFINTCQSNYSKAFEYEMKALSIDEKIGNNYGLERDLENIGEIYSAQGDFPEALKYYFKALKLAEQGNWKRRIAVDLTEIGEVYRLQHNYDSALGYSRRALEINQAIGDKLDFSLVLAHIGKTYQQKGIFDTALQYYTAAIKVSEEVKDKDGIGACYREIGQTYFSVFTAHATNGSRLEGSNMSNILACIHKSIEIDSEVHNLNELQHAYKTLSEIQAYNHDYQASLESHKKYIECRDSVFSAEKTKTITSIELEYAFNLQKDSLNTQARVTEERLKIEKKNRRKEQLYYMSGIVVLLAFSLFVIRSNRTQRKLNNTITTLVNEQEKTIEQRTAALNQSNQKLRELISFNAHQIREPLTRITGAFLVKQHIDKDEFYDEYLPLLEKASNDLDQAIKDVLERTQENLHT